MLRIIFLIVILTVIVFMIFGFPALAQPTDGVSSPDNAVVEIKYFDFFVVKGGPIAFGLIALSIVTIALAIEHAVSIRRVTMVPSHAAEMTKSMGR